MAAVDETAHRTALIRGLFKKYAPESKIEVQVDKRTFTGWSDIDSFEAVERCLETGKLVSKLSEVLKKVKEEIVVPLGAEDSTCYTCRLTFYSPRHLQYHHQFLENEKSIVSNMIPDVIADFNSFDPISGMVFCPWCPVIFRGPLDLITHMKSCRDRTRHGEVVRGSYIRDDLVCSECEQSFSREADLWRHIYVVHGRHYKCSKCEEEFSSRSKFLGHIPLCTGPGKLFCCDCNEPFQRQRFLYRHVTRTTCSLIDPYICVKCGLSFDSRKLILTHLWKHARISRVSEPDTEISKLRIALERTLIDEIPDVPQSVEVPEPSIEVPEPSIEVPEPSSEVPVPAKTAEVSKLEAAVATSQPPETKKQVSEPISVPETNELPKPAKTLKVLKPVKTVQLDEPAELFKVPEPPKGRKSRKSSKSSKESKSSAFLPRLPNPFFDTGLLEGSSGFFDRIKLPKPPKSSRRNKRVSRVVKDPHPDESCARTRGDYYVTYDEYDSSESDFSFHCYESIDFDDSNLLPHSKEPLHKLGKTSKDDNLKEPEYVELFSRGEQRQQAELKKSSQEESGAGAANTEQESGPRGKPKSMRSKSPKKKPPVISLLVLDHSYSMPSCKEPSKNRKSSGSAKGSTNKKDSSPKSKNCIEKESPSPTCDESSQKEASPQETKNTSRKSPTKRIGKFRKNSKNNGGKEEGKDTPLPGVSVDADTVGPSSLSNGIEMNVQQPLGLPLNWEDDQTGMPLIQSVTSINNWNNITDASEPVSSPAKDQAKPKEKIHSTLKQNVLSYLNESVDDSSAYDVVFFSDGDDDSDPGNDKEAEDTVSATKGIKKSTELKSTFNSPEMFVAPVSEHGDVTALENPCEEQIVSGNSQEDAAQVSNTLVNLSGNRLVASSNNAEGLGENLSGEVAEQIPEMFIVRENSLGDSSEMYFITESTKENESEMFILSENPVISSSHEILTQNSSDVFVFPGNSQDVYFIEENSVKAMSQVSVYQEKSKSSAISSSDVTASLGNSTVSSSEVIALPVNSAVSSSEVITHPVNSAVSSSDVIALPANSAISSSDVITHPVNSAVSSSEMIALPGNPALSSSEVIAHRGKQSSSSEAITLPVNSAISSSEVIALPGNSAISLSEIIALSGNSSGSTELISLPGRTAVSSSESIVVPESCAFPSSEAPVQTESSENTSYNALPAPSDKRKQILRNVSQTKAGKMFVVADGYLALDSTKPVPNVTEKLPAGSSVQAPVYESLPMYESVPAYEAVLNKGLTDVYLVDPWETKSRPANEQSQKICSVDLPKATKQVAKLNSSKASSFIANILSSLHGPQSSSGKNMLHPSASSNQLQKGFQEVTFTSSHGKLHPVLRPSGLGTGLQFSSEPPTKPSPSIYLAMFVNGCPSPSVRIPLSVVSTSDSATSNTKVVTFRGKVPRTNIGLLPKASRSLIRNESGDISERKGDTESSSAEESAKDISNPKDLELASTLLALGGTKNSAAVLSKEKGAENATATTPDRKKPGHDEKPTSRKLLEKTKSPNKDAASRSTSGSSDSPKKTGVNRTQHAAEKETSSTPPTKTNVIASKKETTKTKMADVASTEDNRFDSSESGDFAPASPASSFGGFGNHDDSDSDSDNPVNPVALMPRSEFDSSSDLDSSDSESTPEKIIFQEVKVLLTRLDEHLDSIAERKSDTVWSLNKDKKDSSFETHGPEEKNNPEGVSRVESEKGENLEEKREDENPEEDKREKEKREEEKHEEDKREKEKRDEEKHVEDKREKERREEENPEEETREVEKREEEKNEVEKREEATREEGANEESSNDCRSDTKEPEMSVSTEDETGVCSQPSVLEEAIPIVKISSPNHAKEDPGTRSEHDDSQETVSREEVTLISENNTLNKEKQHSDCLVSVSEEKTIDAEPVDCKRKEDTTLFLEKEQDTQKSISSSPEGDKSRDFGIPQGKPTLLSPNSEPCDTIDNQESKVSVPDEKIADDESTVSSSGKLKRLAALSESLVSANKDFSHNGDVTPEKNKGILQSDRDEIFCKLCYRTFKNAGRLKIHQKKGQKYCKRGGVNNSPSVSEEVTPCPVSDCQKAPDSQNDMEYIVKPTQDTNSSMPTESVMPSTPTSESLIPNTPTKSVIPSTPTTETLIPSTPTAESVIASTPTTEFAIPSTPAKKSVVPSSPATESVIPSSPPKKSVIPSSPPKKSVIPSSPPKKSVIPSSPPKKSVIPITPTAESVIPITPKAESVIPTTPTKKSVIPSSLTRKCVSLAMDEKQSISSEGSVRLANANKELRRTEKFSGPVRCDCCKRTFLNEVGRKIHVTRMQAKLLSMKKEKGRKVGRFKCPYCDRVFGSALRLDVHLVFKHEEVKSGDKTSQEVVLKPSTLCAKPSPSESDGDIKLCHEKARDGNGSVEPVLKENAVDTAGEENGLSVQSSDHPMTSEINISCAASEKAETPAKCESRVNLASTSPKTSAAVPLSEETRGSRQDSNSPTKAPVPVCEEARTTHQQSSGFDTDAACPTSAFLQSSSSESSDAVKVCQGTQTSSLEPRQQTSSSETNISVPVREETRTSAFQVSQQQSSSSEADAACGESKVSAIEKSPKWSPNSKAHRRPRRSHEEMKMLQEALDSVFLDFADGMQPVTEVVPQELKEPTVEKLVEESEAKSPRKHRKRSLPPSTEFGCTHCRKVFLTEESLETHREWENCRRRNKVQEQKSSIDIATKQTVESSVSSTMIPEKAVDPTVKADENDSRSITELETNFEGTDRRGDRLVRTSGDGLDVAAENTGCPVGEPKETFDKTEGVVQNAGSFVGKSVDSRETGTEKADRKTDNSLNKSRKGVIRSPEEAVEKPGSSVKTEGKVVINSTEETAVKTDLIKKRRRFVRKDPFSRKSAEFQHRCKICLRWFTSRQALFLHVFRNKELGSSGTCFPPGTQIPKSSKEEEKKKKPANLKCEICRRRFSSLQALKSHEFQSKRSGLKSACMSQARAKSLTKLKSLRSLTKDKVRRPDVPDANSGETKPLGLVKRGPRVRFFCVPCGRSFKSNRALQMHNRHSVRLHKIKERLGQQRKGGENAPDKTELLAVVGQVDPLTEEDPLRKPTVPNRRRTCSTCKREFKSEKALRLHKWHALQSGGLQTYCVPKEDKSLETPVGITADIAPDSEKIEREPVSGSLPASEKNECQATDSAVKRLATCEENDKAMVSGSLPASEKNECQATDSAVERLATCEENDEAMVSESFPASQRNEAQKTDSSSESDVTRPRRRRILRTGKGKRMFKNSLYPCDLCSADYGFIKLLFRHVETVHVSPEQHRCQDCGDVFNSHQGLQIHLTMKEAKLLDTINITSRWLSEKSNDSLEEGLEKKRKISEKTEQATTVDSAKTQEEGRNFTLRPDEEPSSAFSDLEATTDPPFSATDSRSIASDGSFVISDKASDSVDDDVPLAKLRRKLSGSPAVALRKRSKRMSKPPARYDVSPVAPKRKKVEQSVSNEVKSPELDPKDQTASPVLSIPTDTLEPTFCKTSVLSFEGRTVWYVSVKCHQDEPEDPTVCCSKCRDCLRKSDIEKHSSTSAECPGSHFICMCPKCRLHFPYDQYSLMDSQTRRERGLLTAEPNSKCDDVGNQAERRPVSTDKDKPDTEANTNIKSCTNGIYDNVPPTDNIIKTCALCRENFEGFSKLERHLKLVHMKLLTCLSCGTCFSEASNWKTHVQDNTCLSRREGNDSRQAESALTDDCQRAPCEKNIASDLDYVMNKNETTVASGSHDACGIFHADKVGNVCSKDSVETQKLFRCSDCHHWFQDKKLLDKHKTTDCDKK